MDDEHVVLLYVQSKHSISYRVKGVTQSERDLIEFTNLILASLEGICGSRYSCGISRIRVLDATTDRLVVAQTFLAMGYCGERKTTYNYIFDWTRYETRISAQAVPAARQPTAHTEKDLSNLAAHQIPGNINPQDKVIPCLVYSKRGLNVFGRFLTTTGESKVKISITLSSIPCQVIFRRGVPKLIG